MNTRIALARKERKVKQDDLAEMCGLTKNFISLIETGKREPSDRTIKDICRALNANEDWLRTGKGEPFKEMTKEEEIAEFTADLFLDQTDSFKKRLVAALAQLTEEQWETLELVIDKISNMKKE